MHLLRSERRKISRGTACEYTLCCDCGEYSIECVEYTEQGEIKDCESIKKITTDKKRAEKIFDSVVENGVCACTLFDIVIDFLC